MKRIITVPAQSLRNIWRDVKEFKAILIIAEAVGLAIAVPFIIMAKNALDSGDARLATIWASTALFSIVALPTILFVVEKITTYEPANRE